MPRNGENEGKNEMHADDEGKKPKLAEITPMEKIETKRKNCDR